MKFVVALANVKLPFETMCAPGQVAANSPESSPGFKWRDATKDLKTPANLRAMSWNKDGKSWAGVDSDGCFGLSLRQAFESDNRYNKKWQELMRNRNIINSITFETADGTRITRAEAFRLNDLMYDLPDPSPPATPEAEDDTALDASV